jgi:hypothetical protein
MNVTCGVGGVCTGTWMLITDQSADCVAMVMAVVTFHLKKVQESARKCERLDKKWNLT